MAMARPKSADALRSRSSFASPESIERLLASPAVVEFTSWAARNPTGWEQLHMLFVKENTNPAGGSFIDNGMYGARGLTKMQWIQKVGKQGFKDPEKAGEVFEAIAQEQLPLSRASSRLSNLDLADSVDPMIYLAQLQRFEQRAVAVNATLDAGDENSPAARFIRYLRERRGTVLRGWRMDIDLRGAGKVSQMDFTNACRKLGKTGQAKLIWDNLRPHHGSTLLEVHELAEQEANNLEEFADTLWNTVGFDLGKAWVFLDTNNQNYLSLEDFRYGAKRLGFKGDCKLLFKGLDLSGLGRVSKGEFMYIGKVSRLAQQRLGGLQQGHTAVADLITWVQRELGGAQELLLKLGLGGATGGGGQGAKGILVGDLAARLTALGFEGDALGAATKAARFEGGTQVSVETLQRLLLGERVAAGEAKPAKTASPGAEGSPTRTQKRWKCSEAWNSSVANISDHNSQKCKATRSYFEPPAKPARRSGSAAKRTKSAARLPQGRALPRAASLGRPDTMLNQRPAWNDNYDHIAQSANKCVTSHTRHYFSDPADKPIREQIRSVVEGRQKATFQPEPRVPDSPHTMWNKLAANDIVTY